MKECQPQARCPPSMPSESPNLHQRCEETTDAVTRTR
jgi:hypothetical protein